ncbi:hypothetical protein V1477_017564 [Vespula maculifrons]|uniref:Uncharacterized protein n=1 Tax=Vespula maculifrons TaxID=7453 RepID=A0ABD2B6F0_VESMC
MSIRMKDSSGKKNCLSDVNGIAESKEILAIYPVDARSSGPAPVKQSLAVGSSHEWLTCAVDCAG